MEEKYYNLLRHSLDTAKQAGAQKARATLTISEEDLVATLNGEPDRITHCADNSISLALFADGRFGSFSTNKLDPDSLDRFIRESVEIVKMISPDECRDLPDRDRICTTALTGDELGLCDQERGRITPEERIETAVGASVFGTVFPEGTPFTIISEEGEYSDSIYETLVMDSEGLCCAHRETCFDYGVEITVEADGEKYSGYWWDSSSFRKELDARSCGTRALQKAISQIGSDAIESGKYNMVIDSEVASKVVSPLLRALGGFAIQQNNSFLMDSLGKQVFPESLTIMDLPHIKGQTCSKLFDSEGVATREHAIIEKGIVKEYFINTYISRKTGMAATNEDATRPALLPTHPGCGREELMRLCSEGILVTDFNGGNSSGVTGDFSYGVEGFLFRKGAIVKPVSGMLITGNFLTLWQNLLASGDDARPCMSKLIPTLAFGNVDFSGN